jgi:hypothetical protein
MVYEAESRRIQHGDIEGLGESFTKVARDISSGPERMDLNFTDGTGTRPIPFLATPELVV